MVDFIDNFVRKHERNDNSCVGKASEISVSYCLANNSAAEYSSSSEATSNVEDNRTLNVVDNELRL